jgi:hypothetical protein
METSLMNTKRIAAVLGAAALAAGISGCNDFKYQTFVAKMDGTHEVPPVTTDGRARMVVLVDPDGTRAEVTVTLSGIKTVTAVHIHRGAAGQPGTAVFTVWSPFDGEFSHDVPVTKSWQPSPGDLEDLATGKLYGELHTEDWPAGEVRAQLLKE